jgi:hypothetical protein
MAGPDDFDGQAAARCPIDLIEYLLKKALDLVPGGKV